MVRTKLEPRAVGECLEARQGLAVTGEEMQRRRKHRAEQHRRPVGERLPRSYHQR
jgi:hypothetical protein